MLLRRKVFYGSIYFAVFVFFIGIYRWTFPHKPHKKPIRRQNNVLSKSAYFNKIYDGEKSMEVTTRASVEFNASHPVATRVCTHMERLRHLRKYCAGEGAAITEQYRKELQDENSFSSSVVSDCMSRIWTQL